MAFPHNPMIIIELPSLVNLPNPLRASGQIPAHINEFASPNKTTNHIEIFAVWPKKLTCPFAKIINNVKSVPSKVHILSAFN